MPLIVRFIFFDAAELLESLVAIVAPWEEIVTGSFSLTILKNFAKSRKELL